MYEDFSTKYDLLMDNVPYDKWEKRILKEFKKYDIKPSLCLDLGCGTGEMTLRLAKAGYDMIGVDSSFEMLEEATKKSEKEDEDILFLCQDMREFELYGTVQSVISVCDSINYITNKDDLLKVFKLVNNYLEPGGLFIFDFNTPKKYKMIGCNTIAENREDLSFIWENWYDSETNINEIDLTLFIKREEETYERCEETHIQRGYEKEDIEYILKLAGLEVLSFTDISKDEGETRQKRYLAVSRLPKDTKKKIFEEN